ncbi:hypothetical protein EYR41_006106 [Orbilia oligospora]|uniref:Uncharacterized protein n=1 Tax=Orbilia oligospora TaxID=2813651 RepID=A0A8H2E1I8_ORBOL|nr:hypothetical protein EYR41_006106 [Orbilia oligospora]
MISQDSKVLLYEELLYAWFYMHLDSGFQSLVLGHLAEFLARTPQSKIASHIACALAKLRFFLSFNPHLPITDHYLEHHSELDPEDDDMSISSDTSTGATDDSGDCQDSIHSADDLYANAESPILNMIDCVAAVLNSENVLSAEALYKYILEYQRAHFNTLNSLWRSRKGNDEFLNKAVILISFVHLFRWSKTGWKDNYELNEVETRFMGAQKLDSTGFPCNDELEQRREHIIAFLKKEWIIKVEGHVSNS